MLTYNYETVEGPVYEYIYKCIKEDILSGNLKPNEKLPSKRTFARNNGISTITIQNAYDQLIAEGYIYAVERRGYFVSDFHVVREKKSVSYDIKIPKKKEYQYDFAYNRMNTDNFPFSIWARLGREVLSENKEGLMQIAPGAGLLELREAIAMHLQSFRGMAVDPNQIVIGAGTEYLYGLLVQLLGRDKIYGIENPGYKKLLKIYGQYEVKPKFISLDEWGVELDSLRKSKAQIAHISPNHHFPTGIMTPVSRRYELLSWANEIEGRYILEDDYDSEFRYNGKPLPTLFSIDGCEKVIYMNTFSKSLTPTIRVSYMVLPVHLANKFYEKFSFRSCTVSNFEQYILTKFIREGYFEKHINRMRLYYVRQRKQVIKCIYDSSIRDSCEIIESSAGLHFILKLQTKVSDEEMKQRLEEEGIHIDTISDYYMTKNKIKEHMFILDYSNIQIEKLAEACEIMYNCMDGKNTPSD
ncbi:MAG: PLP-dependent aminotransferase family protein [Lachnospiraceae bacterium]|nr:PLP-dependent aminotransferase family protein [Lachnospiraceae bacterium]